MATGDLKNNLRKLIAELKQARFPQDDLDVRGLAHGNPSAFLPIVHYIFLDFSCALAQHFAEKDYELYGKNDLRFLEVVYRILRDEFGFKPLLTRGQFLTIGFAERKILLLSDILRFCQERHKQLNPKRGKPERKAKNVKIDQKQVNDTSKQDRHVNTSETFRNVEHLTEQENRKELRSIGEVVLAEGIPLSQERESWLENKENLEHLPRQPLNDKISARAEIAFQSNTAPSELIIKTLCSQEGGKFKPMTYTTAASKNNNSSRIKSVTWYDDVSTVQAFDGTAEQCMLPWQQRHALMTHQPGMSLNGTEGSVDNPQGGFRSPPAPIQWTAAPLPSDDLLLTPSGKAAHQVIPLSGSRGYQPSLTADISMVDITHSFNVPRAQVTRHKPSLASVGEGFGHDSPSQPVLALNEEVSLLKNQLQELQGKFDSVVLQNNEMSARVIVLESKVKLLEESSSKNACNDCRRAVQSTNAPASTSNVKVVSGFDIRRSASMDEGEFDSLNTNSHSRRLYSETSNHSMEDIQGTTSAQQDSTESSGKQKQPTKIVVNLPTVSENFEVSENHDPSSLCLSTPTRSCEDSFPESHVVLSPLTTPEYTLAYVGSATKATVANVHKRLKETREMLMKTNRDFVARFDHSQPE